MYAKQIKLLIDSINNKLPFTPPFQYKKFDEEPYPLTFTENVSYLGHWSAPCLLPYSKIEWFCVRPQYLKYESRLIPEEVITCELASIKLLQNLDVPYNVQGDAIFIYCN